MRAFHRPLIVLLFLALPAVLSAVEPRWWKGNLHTHSLWSDGDDYPEMIADWYRERGYHFLALSDHNIFQEGEKWVAITNKPSGPAALEKYQARFGVPWVEQRTEAGRAMVRLKTLAEFRSRLEEPGRFLLIPSEELTDRYQVLPVHINVTNIRQPLQPAGGASVLEVMQKNMNAVREQRRRTGQPMFPHINHPNFGWALTAEDLANVRGENFFEVYNAHPSVHNEGDEQRPGTERLWDIALAHRFSQPNPEPLYGLAVDDSHHYHRVDPKASMPGRGWVMVRAPKLEASALVAAMERGDFYASSGVTLRSVNRSGKTLKVEVEPEANVSYRIEFIATNAGFDPASSVVVIPGRSLPVVRKYSADIGKVVQETRGASAAYTLKGNELYVRARVISDKPKSLSAVAGETEMAWTQPVYSGKKNLHSRPRAQ